MKRSLILLATVPLLLAACSDKQEAPAESDAAAPPAEVAENGDSALGDEAKAWTDQTKKLGSAAWDSTKKAASDAAEAGGEMLEGAQESAGDALDAAQQKAGEVYDAAKTEGSELLQKGSDLLEQGGDGETEAPQGD